MYISFLTQVITLTLQACRRQMTLLLILLMVAMVLSGATVFYTEMNEDVFQSIPHAYWWAIITMTTVGYGDYMPVTGLGRCVGGLCAIFGILAITVIIPIISNQFLIYYDGLRMNSGGNDLWTKRMMRKASVDVMNVGNDIWELNGSVEREECKHQTISEIDIHHQVNTVYMTSV